VPLSVALVPAPDQVVVRFTGDADLSTLPAITEALGHGASLGTQHVVVDLAAARFWDCSGLNALAAFTADLAAAGRSCRIVGALRDTRRLIGLSYLTHRLVLDGAIPAQPTRRALPRQGAPARWTVSGHSLPVRGLEPPVGAGRLSRRD
jgi:anti-anti-sigma factor